jgi:hypothetical protein
MKKKTKDSAIHSKTLIHFSIYYNFIFTSCFSLRILTENKPIALKENFQWDILKKKFR